MITSVTLRKPLLKAFQEERQYVWMPKVTRNSSSLSSVTAPAKMAFCKRLSGVHILLHRRCDKKWPKAQGSGRKAKAKRRLSAVSEIQEKEDWKFGKHGGWKEFDLKIKND